MNDRGMPLPRNSVVLLTGASTGLGLAIAHRLLCLPYRLILTARADSLSRFRENGINETSRVWLRPLDVRNELEREAIITEANERWDGIDVLINNAGVAFRTVVEHMTPECAREQLDVNFHAPMELVRAVLPRMREKRSGRIINISSVGGMMAMPTMALYSASKFALEGASEALWYEVRPWNIQVTLVQPGFIHSDSFENTRYSPDSRFAAENGADPYHAHYENMSGMIGKLMKRTWATPDHVAEVVLKTMQRRRAPMRIAGTPDARLFGILRRFLPRNLYHRVLYRSLPEVGTWGTPALPIQKNSTTKKAPIPTASVD